MSMFKVLSQASVASALANLATASHPVTVAPATASGHAVNLGQVNDGGVRPESYGALGDWTDTTATLGTGTDDTAAFQLAVDHVLATEGAWLKLTGKYLINGTVYISQSNNNTQFPFTMRGVTGNPLNTRGHGAAIVRTVTGDCFRVNLDTSGNVVLGSSFQFVQLAVENLSFIGKSVSEGVNVGGMVGVKAMRTRMSVKNVCASRFDYLVYQPLVDASAVDNYCDQSLYENIRIEVSTLSGMMLTRPDSSIVKGFFFEQPTTTATHGLEINYGSGTKLEGILHWIAAGSYTPAAGSSFIHLFQCEATEVSTVHAERNLLFSSLIHADACNQTTIKNVKEKFSSNTFLKNDNSNSTQLQQWNASVDRQASTYDIDITGTAANNLDVTWKGTKFTDATGVTARDISINNTSGVSSSALLGVAGYPIDGATVTDAASTITLANRAYKLPVISANRNLTLPTPAAGQWLILINLNTNNSNSWFPQAASAVRMPDDNNLTQYRNKSTVFLLADTVTAVWRVVWSGHRGPINGTPIDNLLGVSSTGSTDVFANFELITTAGSTITRTLPDAATYRGENFTFKKIDSGVGTVVVTKGGSDTIEGATTKTLTGQWSSVTLAAGGGVWYIKSTTGTVS